MFLFNPTTSLILISGHILSYLLLVGSAVNGQDELPPLWPAIRPDKSYKLTFHLHMLNSAERVTIEEWASFDDHLFRLDLVTADTRTTYLTNGQTNEVFRYRPYSCEQLDPNSDDLGAIGGLFMGYSLAHDNTPDGGSSKTPETSQPIKAFGLGPLWLRALKEAKIQLISDEPASSKRYRINKFVESFNIYDVRFDTKEGDQSSTKFDLRFLFPRDGAKHFVTVVEWLPRLGSKKGMTRRKAEARAKLVLLDLSSIDGSIFDLPVGYGCRRSSEKKVDPESLAVELLRPGSPSQATMDVSLSWPTDQRLRTWESQRFTIRVSRGSLLTDGFERNYYASETQARDPETWVQRRARRVWSSLANSEESIVYTIEAASNTCQVKHMNHKQLMQLSFPKFGSQADASREDADDGSDTTLDGLTISLELIVSLFADKNDYHVLEEKTSSSLVSDMYRETVYEKRVDKLEIEGQPETVWSAPVSIVKRVHTYSMYTDSKKSSVLISQYHASMTLLFYSTDLSTIQYKAVIELLESQPITIGYLHKQLDIGVCFKPEQRAGVVIKYPLESAQLAEKLHDARELVEELALMSMFLAAPFQPLQMSAVELEFDSFFMHVKFTLLDLPLTQTFELTRGKRLVARSDGAILEKKASSTDRCALACDHYHCTSFSYEVLETRCRLGIPGFVESLATESCDVCTLYQSGGKTGRHLHPLELIDLFSKSVATSAGSSGGGQTGVVQAGDTSAATNIASSLASDEAPLRIDVPAIVLWDSFEEDAPEVIQLNPISVHSDLDSMNEFMREDGSSVVALDSSRLRVDYLVLLEAREFSPSVGQDQAGELTYEECAQICEDSDCRSFSHTRATQKCRTTNLHKSGDIEYLTAPSITGTVFVLDYLSKFEPLGSTLHPRVAQRITYQMSESDCAGVCMEEEEFDCQGFYRCSQKVEGRDKIQSRCLLQKYHIETDDEINTAGYTVSSSEVTDKYVGKDKLEVCNYYSRSYLAQFDEYHGKALEIPADEDMQAVEPHSGLGSESCARLCIQRSCLAFDLCHGKSDDDTRLTRQCRFAERIVKKSHLVTRDKCTTFVLSDRSQFNLNKNALIFDGSKPERPALEKPGDAKNVIDPKDEPPLDNPFNLPDEVTHATKTTGTHRIQSLLIGTLIGVCAGFIWREKDTVYNIVTSVNARLRA